MAEFFSQIKPATSGERLLLRLSKHGMKDLGANRLGQQKFVRLTGRGEQFGAYLEGAMIAFAFKRAMKAAHGIFSDKGADPVACNARLTAILRDWFAWLDRDNISLLVRDVIRAQTASYNKIPKSIEAEIWRARRIHACCFCGDRMIADSHSIVRDSKGIKATLEHIWPSSLGGDSITENLVPACSECNTIKSDLCTWEQGCIHDFIYPIDFHLSDFLPRLPIEQRILVQRRAVMVLAQRDKLSLKEALLRVGPYGDLKPLDANDTWDIFNIENHIASLGELLW